MGNEIFDVSLRAIIDRTTKINNHVKQGQNEKPLTLDKETSFLSSKLLTAKLETEPKQPNSLLVLDSSERLKAWYAHLEGRYFDSVVSYEGIEPLVAGNDHIDTARCVIFEIQKNRVTDTSFITSILENYPKANLIITVAEGTTAFFSDIAAYSDRISILERPFSMSNLVALVRQLTP